MLKLLGTITVPAGAARNNATTAVPFPIPDTCRLLKLVTSDPDLVVEVTPDAVPPTYATTAAKGLSVRGALDVRCTSFGGANFGGKDANHDGTLTAARTSANCVSSFNSGAGAESLQVYGEVTS